MDPKANLWMFGLTRWMKFLLCRMDELNSRNQLDAKNFSWCTYVVVTYHSQDRLQATSPWTAPWYVGEWNSCFYSSGSSASRFEMLSIVGFRWHFRAIFVWTQEKIQDGVDGGHFSFSNTNWEQRECDAETYFAEKLFTERPAGNSQPSFQHWKQKQETTRQDQVRSKTR